MSLPFNDGGIWSGLLCGVLFGFVLESAGFGSPCKLTAQFRLSDWSVFKVMFTAIVVAALGLWGLRTAGAIEADALFVPGSLVLAAAIGGALVGAGFAVGGYCPGTSVVGLFSGRLDALAFLLGLLLGTVVFAGLYGPAVEHLLAVGEIASGDTFAEQHALPRIAAPMDACEVAAHGNIHREFVEFAAHCRRRQIRVVVFPIFAITRRLHREAQFAVFVEQRLEHRHAGASDRRMPRRIRWMRGAALRERLRQERRTKLFAHAFYRV